MTDGEYVRVYHAIVDDPKFADVFDNDGALATWLRLLIIADQAWPASAHLPGNVKRRAFDLLVRAGLVDQQPGWRYRIHGLDAERNARAASARNAAAKRWQNARNATASGSEMPSKARARAEQEQSTPDDGASDPEWLKSWFATGHAYMPSPKQQQLIDGYLRAFDVTGDARLSDVFLRNPTDPIAGLKADLERFRAERSAAARAADEAPKPKRPNRQLLIARHNGGSHAGAPDWECPLCQGGKAA